MHSSKEKKKIKKPSYLHKTYFKLLNICNTYSHSTDTILKMVSFF